MKKSIPIIAAILLLTANPKIALCAEKSGYVYTIINNQATVTGFQGEPTYIDLPETVEGCKIVEIRDNAFYECTSLRHITLPDTIEKIGHHSFYGCTSLESVAIPDSVTELGMGAFCGCEKLSSATISESLKRLPESCFRSCPSLKSVVIPENVTDIGDFCFSGCTSLISASLGDSVRMLGDCAFYMCPSMKAMYVPPSVELIGVCSVGYIPTNDGAQPLEGFTVLGEKKSAARAYAEENDLTFESASDSVHAMAIQRISGRRIAIPSVYLIVGGAAILALFVLKRRRKLGIKKS